MRYFLSFLFLALVLTVNAQHELTYYETQDGDKHLLGSFDRAELMKDSFKLWYNMVYENYELKEELLSKVDKFYDDEVEVKIYLGTWCGDSKREVTRFLKLVDHSNIVIENITLVGLDGRNENRKQGPNGEEKGLHIHRVPTFLFYKNGEEIGRIVESPTTSIEADVAQIYAGLAPRPNYRVANYLLQEFDSQNITELDTLVTKNARYFRRIAKNERELNTLGYVLLAAERYDEAILAFKLNTLMYPESANTYDSLGEAYLKVENRELAINNYIKSLQLDENNENAVLMMQEILNTNDSD